MIDPGKGPAKGNLAPPAEGRSVMIDGFLGREMSDFDLSSLLPSQLGSDAFTEVYVETDSNNTYSLIDLGEMYPDQYPPHTFSIFNGRELQARAKRGEKGLAVEYVMRPEDMEAGRLEVGEPFHYAGGNTSRLKKITCVNTGRIYSPDELGRITEGASDVRSNFWESAGLRPPQAHELVSR